MFTNQIKEFSQLSDLLKGRNQQLMDQVRALSVLDSSFEPL